MTININLCKQEIEEILAEHLRRTIPALGEVRIGEVTNSANGALETMAICAIIGKEAK